METTELVVRIIKTRPPAPKAGEQLDKYRPSSPPPSLERVIVVDTETTGFGKMDRIVQIAWAVHDTASQVKVDSACFTVHPGSTPFIVPRRVATIHGITNDVQKKQQKIKIPGLT